MGVWGASWGMSWGASWDATASVGVWGASWGASWGVSWGATASGDSSASGETISVAASIASGSAVGENNGGQPVPFPVGSVGGRIWRRDARANGAVLSASISFISGVARVQAAAIGGTIEARVHIISGAASGDAFVRSWDISTVVSIEPGIAKFTPDPRLVDDDFLLLAA